MHKLVGAAAERGLSLDAVYSVGVAAAECVKSVGVALGTCTVPGAPTRNSRLDGDVVEMGLGIHGEPGVAKRSLQTANETTDAMLTILLKAFGDSLPLSVAVLVNNLGGASALEVSLVLGRTVATLTEKGIAVLRVYSGHVMTALNMHGVSISLLPIQKPEWLELLDDPVTASGWPSGGDPRARSPLVPLPHNPARTVTATKSCKMTQVMH